jgi:hypothetical protein
MSVCVTLMGKLFVTLTLKTGKENGRIILKCLMSDVFTKKSHNLKKVYSHIYQTSISCNSFNFTKAQNKLCIIVICKVKVK